MTTYRDRHLAGEYDTAKQEAKAEAKDAKDKADASTKAATKKT